MNASLLRCFLFVLFPGLAAAVDLPLRLNCGGPDVDGWVSDARWAQGGTPFTFGPGHSLTQVKTPGPARIYETVRHQNHRYEIPVPPGRYLVRLHFTDGYPGHNRAMDYRLNGNLIIDDLNVHRAAGGEKRVLVLEAGVEVPKGKPLVIEANRGDGDDVFQAGIEILASPKAAIPTAPVNPRSPAPQPSSGLPAAERARAIRDFTGAPTRLVWLQGSAYQSYTDAKSRVRLMGFDTGDKRGERAILEAEGAYSKPLFTPDGKRIVFSDRKTRRVHLVDWDGSNLRDLGEGFASEVWRGPGSRVDWVYLRTGKGRKEDPIVRRRLDRAGDKDEMVWDRTPNGHDGVPWFQLSADGKQFSDAFPWSACGAGDPAKGEWEEFGSGCWPGMAPDNSYRMFVFEGNHVQVSFFEAGGTGKRKVDISTIPDSPGNKVYHPRWSNHVRFFTVTSPEGSPRNELYLGRFDSAWGGVEDWVRITDNDRTELFGDAWIQSGPGAP